MTLASVNAEESLFSRQYSGRLDTSQDGNWCNFRNGTLNKLPFVLTNENIDELLGPYTPYTKVGAAR
jgi:hypothetical protein